MRHTHVYLSSSDVKVLEVLTPLTDGHDCHTTDARVLTFNHPLSESISLLSHPLTLHLHALLALLHTL